jgi:photosystem II stability/assembly factor-like uncharacterized protein
MRALVLAALLTAAPLALQAQWSIQTPTTADLRGIDNVGKGIAWASGTNGTVLRTEDAGYLWQACTIPPNAEHLDFRAIQAFDANTAIVMSSGPGDQSRLYKTTDGCQTWTLLFTNPDKTGFWDALIFRNKYSGWLLGDPVDGTFVIATVDPEGGQSVISDMNSAAHWRDARFAKQLQAFGRGAFAASNSSLLLSPGGAPLDKCERSEMWFGTSGPNGAKVFRFTLDFHPACADSAIYNWFSADVPIAGSNSSSGAFSLGAEDDRSLVAIGGDYLKPDQRNGTAAYSDDGGKTWLAATTPPHGYRSSVAYDPATRTWITVGPNGTDISTDDGRNWRPLHPSNNEAPDADQHWNALSLPYAVGPRGRIGLLNPSALTKPQ